MISYHCSTSGDIARSLGKCSCSLKHLDTRAMDWLKIATEVAMETITEGALDEYGV